MDNQSRWILEYKGIWHCKYLDELTCLFAHLTVFCPLLQVGGMTCGKSIGIRGTSAGIITLVVPILAIFYY